MISKMQLVASQVLDGGGIGGAPQASVRFGHHCTSFRSHKSVTATWLLLNPTHRGTVSLPLTWPEAIALRFPVPGVLFQIQPSATETNPKDKPRRDGLTSWQRQRRQRRCVPAIVAFAAEFGPHEYVRARKSDPTSTDSLLDSGCRRRC